MIEATCLIAATCRNVGEYFPKNLTTLETIGGLFSSVHYMFVENDSTDTTVQHLRDFQTTLGEDKVTLLLLGTLSATMPKRTERLAHCRNLVLDQAHAYDYLLWVDVDDRLQYPFDTSRLLSCFQYSDWTMLSANQPTFYYDIWALRRPGLDYDVYDLERAYTKKYGYIPAHVYVKLLTYFHSFVARYHQNTPLIPVRSAFGGMAIYNTKRFKPCCRYIGLDADGNEQCEHVSFNTCLNNHHPGTLYIYPGLVNHW